MKLFTFVLAALLGSAVHAADLDILLQQIKTDIAAKRLSTPAGNNALERIDEFREQAPFDYRVLPLVYQWGDAYLQLANEAMDSGDTGKADLYLQRVWRVASLTPGLEQAQARLDDLQSSGTQVAKGKGQQKDSAAEAERQRRVAAAAAAEKARLEQERKRRLERARKEAEAEKQRVLAERKQRQEEERRRRAEAESAAQQAQLAAGSTTAPVPVAEPPSAEEVANVRELWEQAEEESAPLADFPLDATMVADRNRKISDSLTPICQAILDNDASVVIHTAEESDYRWLTVRFTLCLRHLSDSFRLRHSHETLTTAEPHVTLHPSRDVSLVRQAAD